MILKDFKLVTPRQRELLTRMLNYVFIELRQLCWEKKAEQAAALADTFRNLPSGIHSKTFSFSWLRGELELYRSRYKGGLDYVAMLDRAEREEQLIPDTQ